LKVEIKQDSNKAKEELEFERVKRMTNKPRLDLGYRNTTKNKIRALNFA